jgi:hypothetical protein
MKGGFAAFFWFLTAFLVFILNLLNFENDSFLLGSNLNSHFIRFAHENRIEATFSWVCFCFD